MNEISFQWVSFYKELANKLLKFKDDRKPLVEKVYRIFDMTGISMPTLEKDNELIDIDPFTFFGLFNKISMRVANRVKIIAAVAELFEITTHVPTSFESIPVLNNQNATFYKFIGYRADDDIQSLWELFETALAYSEDSSDKNRESLAKCFDISINRKGNGNGKITMGLYWIAPDVFLNLD